MQLGKVRARAFVMKRGDLPLSKLFRVGLQRSDSWSPMRAMFTETWRGDPGRSVLLYANKLIVSAYYKGWGNTLGRFGL